MRRLFPFLAFLLLPAACFAAPRVVASIAPLHGIVAAVMADVGAPERLLPPHASPHGYALRPSEAKSLNGADAVFWIGPALETFLARPLESLASGAEVIAVAEAPGVHRLPVRDPLEAHANGHHDLSHDGDYDPHVWLSLDNARRIAEVVAERLAVVDPGNAVRYATNARRFGERVLALRESLRERFAAAAGTPFMVFHDAYQYFEEEMRLDNRGAITLRADVSPGVARVQALRRVIARDGIACVFSEPQFPGALVATVAEDANVRVAELDPLGVKVPPGPDSYETLIDRFAGTILACLEAD